MTTPKLRNLDEVGPGGVKKTLSLPASAKGAGILSVSTNRKPPTKPAVPIKKGANEPRKNPPAPQLPPEDEGPGRRVFGVEPYIAKGEIGVVVAERAVVKEYFGPMTIAVGGDEPKRYFLRSVGAGQSPSGRSVLILKTSGPDETQAIAESYLHAGEAMLYEGIEE